MEQISTLTNGRLLLEQTWSGVKNTFFGIGFDAGSRIEPAHLHGGSHLLEHLVFKGPKHMSKKAFNQAFTRYGGSTNAFTSWNTVFYYVKAPTRNIVKTARLYYQALTELDFTQQDLEIEKQIVIEELKMRKQNPTLTLLEETMAQTFKHTTLARNIGGTIETIQAITKQELLEFKHQHYTPQRSLLTLTGGQPTAQQHQELIELYSQGTPNTHQLHPINETPVHNPLIHQTPYNGDRIITLLTTAVPNNTPQQAITMTLLDEIFSKSKRSIFYKEIQAPGISPDATTFLLTQPDTTVWNILYTTDTENYKQVTQKILETLQAFLEQEHTTEDLESWKQESMGATLLQLESVTSTGMLLEHNYFNLGIKGTLTQYLQTFQTITPEHINTLKQQLQAQRYTMGIKTPKNHEITIPEHHYLP